MTRMIFCQKLKQEAEGLDRPVYPGEFGQKIYEHISKIAWQQWIEHQTMLINEYKLNMMDKKARDFIKIEMEKFLFGEGSEKPSGFVPKTDLTS